MKPSARISGVVEGGSDGWEVYYRARDMRDAGHAITMLTIGDHDLPTPAPILDAMDRSARGGNTGYAAVPGSKSLRAAIARRVEARTGVPTGPENVMVTPGGQAALFAAHMAALEPGDRALFVDPHYATFPGTIRAASGRPVAVRARPEHGFQIAVDDLAAAGRARSLLINTPNNPTGVVYSRATLEGIAAFVTEHRMWLISDEVYDTQVWEGSHLSPRALPDLAERTLVIGSMSKTFVMTGARLGWVIGPEAMVAKLADLAVCTTYGVPGFVQDAAEWALTEGSGIERDIAAMYARRRKLALETLAGVNAVTPVPSQGAMYIMLDIRETGLTGRAFAEGLLDEHGIAVMPGESFGRAAAGHVRVALTVEDSRLAAALTTLCAHAAERIENG
ncbi:MAG: pyridoxal phosphate-dependent aminotransferase [Paracoccaceae bacterium]